MLHWVDSHLVWLNQFWLACMWWERPGNEAILGFMPPRYGCMIHIMYIYLYVMVYNDKGHDVDRCSYMYNISAVLASLVVT